MLAERARVQEPETKISREESGEIIQSMWNSLGFRSSEEGLLHATHVMAADLEQAERDAEASSREVAELRRGADAGTREVAELRRETENLRREVEELRRDRRTAQHVQGEAEAIRLDRERVAALEAQWARERTDEARSRSAPPPPTARNRSPTGLPEQF